MPELCRIYEPAFDNHEDRWGLRTHIVTYTGNDAGWHMNIAGDRLTVQDFPDLQTVVDFIAEHNGWFTDYKEARNYIARENA